MWLGRFILALLLLCIVASLQARSGSGEQADAAGRIPTYTVEQGVVLADAQNPEVVIARKKLEAARGDLISARSGYLPSVISNGLYDKRQHQNDTRLRD